MAKPRRLRTPFDYAKRVGTITISWESGKTIQLSMVEATK